MDQGPLVREEIDEGAKLAREFDRYAPVKVVFWLKASDEELMDDAVDAGDPRLAGMRPSEIPTSQALQMTAPDGKSRSETVKPGDLHWVDAQVTHVLANQGSTPGTVVEFELK